MRPNLATTAQRGAAADAYAAFTAITAETARAQAAEAAAAALTPTATKSTNYTAAVGELVRVDCSGSDPTVTAPASPSDGQRFGVEIVVATPANHACTIVPNTSQFFDVNSGGSNRTGSYVGDTTIFQWFNSYNSWGIVAQAFGLTPLSVSTTAQTAVAAEAISRAAGDFPTTTRGDLPYHGNSGRTRLALGSAKYHLGSDGTDALWTPAARVTVGDNGSTLSNTANADTLTSVLSGGAVSGGFPAGYAAGDTVTIDAGGTLQTTATNSTFRWQFVYGSTAIADHTTAAFTATANPWRWVARLVVMYQSVGASATISVSAVLHVSASTTDTLWANSVSTSGTYPRQGSGTVASIATNAAASLDLKMAYGNKASTTIIVCDHLSAIYTPKL